MNKPETIRDYCTGPQFEELFGIPLDSLSVYNLGQQRVVKMIEGAEYKISGLSQREKVVLGNRLGLIGTDTAPKTLEEVAVQIGRTSRTVRRVESQALAKLNDYLRINKRLQPALGI